MHNLFLAYLVKLYMFWGYLGPSSGATTLCIQQLVQQSNQDKRQLSKKNNKYKLCIHTVVPPDDGPRYARKRYDIEMHGQHNIKYMSSVCLCPLRL
jgi:hypothetical protein